MPTDSANIFMNAKTATLT